MTGKSTADMTGTWSYTGSAIEFESDNLLQKAGGMEAEQAARTVGMCQECKRELDALRAASAVKTGNAHGMAANETLASGEPQGPGMEYLGGHGVNPEYIDRELNPDAPEIPAGPAPVEGIIMDFDTKEE